MSVRVARVLWSLDSEGVDLVVDDDGNLILRHDDGYARIYLTRDNAMAISDALAQWLAEDI